MSVKIMGLIFDSTFSPMEKLVMLTYADYANAEGYSIYPSVDTMARRTSLSDRSIQRISTRLVNKEVLERNGTSKYGTNEYRIVVENLPYEGGDSVSGVTLCRPGGDSVSPDSRTDSNTLSTREEKIPEKPEQPNIRESSRSPEDTPENTGDLFADVKARQPPVIPTVRHSKEELISFTQRSLSAFSEKHHKDKTEIDLSRFPADVFPLAERFVSLYRIGPAGRSELAFWIKELRDQYDKGISPADIESSFRVSIKDNLCIKSPASLTNNAYTIKLKRESENRDVEKLRAMMDRPQEDTLAMRAARGEKVDIYKQHAQIDLSEFQ